MLLGSVVMAALCAGRCHRVPARVLRRLVIELGLCMSSVQVLALVCVCLAGVPGMGGVFAVALTPIAGGRVVCGVVVCCVLRHAV